MKEVNKEKKYSPKNLKKFEDLEMEEIKNIMGKLSEMHNDIRKMVGNSTRLRLETALENSRKKYLYYLLNHLFEDIEIGFEQRMVEKFPEKENCTSKFTGLLHQNSGLIKTTKLMKPLFQITEIC